MSETKLSLDRNRTGEPTTKAAGSSPNTDEGERPRDDGPAGAEKEQPTTPSRETLQVVELELDGIDAEDLTFNLREDIDVEALAKNVEALGSTTPIVVRPKSDGRYQILSGFGRVAAAKKNGHRKLDAIVREDLKDDDRAYEVVLAENMVRRSYSEHEKLVIFRTLDERKCSMERIAILMGLSERMARNYRDVGQLPDEITRLLATQDSLKITHLMELAKARREDPKLDLLHWVKRCASEKLSRAALVAELAQHQTDQKNATPSPAGTSRKKSRSSSAKKPAGLLYDAGETDWDQGVVVMPGGRLALDQMPAEKLRDLVEQSERLTEEVKKRLQSTEEDEADGATS